MYEFSVVCIGVICAIEIVRLIKDFNIPKKIKRFIMQKRFKDDHF